MKGGEGGSIYECCANGNEAVTTPCHREPPAGLAFRIAPGKEVT